MHSQQKNIQYEFPLTFGESSGRWQTLEELFQRALAKLSSQDSFRYKQSQKAVETFFAENPIHLPLPIKHDDDAKDLLNTVFDVEQSLAQGDDKKIDQIRKTGRHIREFLSDWLLERHFDFLRSHLERETQGARELIQALGLETSFQTPRAIQRFIQKIEIYMSVGSFVHVNELLLSSVKVKTRAGARAKRGNLWHVERREKFAFLENFADNNRVCPAFLESDLEFLVSQSSMEMLKKKTDLILKEFGYIEPNRLKANYSRLKEHLHRSKQRQSDYQLRRDLLIKMGATQEQIDYISARATYQTMQNLLRMADGKLAISDLMGGKRTIRKLLRRKGKMQSKAEKQIAIYLREDEGISRKIAENYAKTRKNHSLEHLKKTIGFLKDNYARFYREHWGFKIQPAIARSALELGLSRQKLSKRTLTKKNFMTDLKRAVAMVEATAVQKQDRLSEPARRQALLPLREVLDYETDTDTRKQLFFIYEQFCENGLCLPKDKLKKNCMDNAKLFPTPRKVQDALEILNGAYRAIGQHGETVCVLPDYLDIDMKNAVSNN